MGIEPVRMEYVVISVFPPAALPDSNEKIMQKKEKINIHYRVSLIKE